MDERLIGAAVGGEPEIDGDGGRVRDDVPRNPAIDPHRGQPLPILAAVDVDDARPICGEPVQDGAELVNGVVPQPGSRRMRAGTGGPDHHAQCALATRLDETGGGFAEDRKVGIEPLG